MKKKKKIVKKKKVVAKKKATKKSSRARKPVKKASARMHEEKPIGTVTHFYGHIKVAVVKFKSSVSVGDSIAFRGATTDFEQKIDSMQYDHVAIRKAPKGKQVGMKVRKRVREGDGVYAVK